MTQYKNEKIGGRWSVFAFFDKSQSKVFINEIRRPLTAYDLLSECSARVV